MSERKLDQLECLRGIAALSVVGWHLRLGFSMRPTTDSSNPSFFEALFDAFFNAGAAVTFFFVLSGVVLTLTYHRSGDLRVLSRGVVKRWPRLAGACTISVLLSWMIFAAGGDHFIAASRITGSGWLAGFGGAELPKPFSPSWQDALWQGAFATFYRGEMYYNSSLWTMRPEIVGSLLSFALAPIFRSVAKPWLVFVALFSVSVMLMRLDAHIPSFLIGVVLAKYVHEGATQIKPKPTAALVVLGIVLLTFNGPVGPFAFLQGIVPQHPRLTLLVWDAGAALLIYVAICSDGMAQALSGYLARWLGRLSFPIYLVHVPILCSLGAYVYVHIFEIGGAQAALLAASAATLLGTIFAAIPLAWFDRWWVSRVNLVGRYLMGGADPILPARSATPIA